MNPKSDLVGVLLPGSSCGGHPARINITEALCKERPYAISRNVISFVVPTHIKITYTFMFLFLHKNSPSEVSFNCKHLPCVLNIVTFLLVLIHYIHNYVYFCVMSLPLLTKGLWDSGTDCSSCSQDVTTFSGRECNVGTHKKFQCHLHFITCACGPPIGRCCLVHIEATSILIGWGIYDVINVIKRPDHVSGTQSKFRPCLDHNPVFIEILR